MTATRRLLGTLLLLAVVLVGLPLVASPASATSTYLCTGYTGCKDAGYAHFGYKKASGQMWWRMYSGHNCTNYVAYRMVKRGMSASRPWGGSGMAYNWGRANRAITNQTPMVGAVAWWNANSGGVGSSGHVAYVQQVFSNRKITISEDSWSGDFHWRTITKGSGSWPSGFVHFMDESIQLRTQPAVTGAPVVGGTLSATSGKWKPSPTFRYQWFANGVAIDGATTPTFVPTTGQRGKQLSVRVTASQKGYADGVSMSESTAKVGKGTLARTAVPTISGTARVDEDLTVEPATWSPAPDTTEIQWYADGEPIAGATGRRLHLDQEQIHQRITVTTVARKAGYKVARATSQPTAAVAAGHIDVIDPFVLSGEPRMGRTLTVTKGTFDPANAAVAYQWLRDGNPIADATTRSYQLTAADVGSQVSMKVVLSEQGYQNKTVVLDAAGVVQTVPSLKVSATGKSRRAVVTLRVTAPGVASPGGMATVSSGSHEVTGRVVDGRLRIVLEDLRPGTRTIKVSYAGTQIVLPGRSSTTVDVLE